MQQGSVTINGQTFPAEGGFSRAEYYYQYDGALWTSLLDSELWDASPPPPPPPPHRKVWTVYDGAGLVMPLTFFGGTWHNWPNTSPGSIKAADEGCKFGASRSHDYAPNSYGPTVNGAKKPHLMWFALEPTNGDWTWWDNFDKWVGDHYAAGRELMFTLFGSPGWASAGADQGSNYVPKASNPPDNDADWVDFCTQVATRAAGRIKYWEVWNEPNAGNAWYTGTHARYAELCRLASGAIKAVMPTAKICGPCVTSWGSVPVGSAAATWFATALEASDGAGGKCKDWLDAITVHLYEQTTQYLALPAVTAEIRRLMGLSGIGSLDLIDSESGFINPLLKNESPDVAALWFKRRMIYIAAAGYKATYFYDMDGDSMGWLTQNKASKASAAAAWNEMVDLLQSGAVTRVNMLWDGRLACIINGQRVLI